MINSYKKLYTFIFHVGVFFLCSILFSNASNANPTDKPIILKSGIKQTILVELYTSEGCSSCPAADRWIANLQNNKRLWKDFIPVAFHVDYWNYLGWKDRFSFKKFSKRQRYYRQIGKARSVYTPGFMVNGKEWYAWFNSSQRKLYKFDNKRTGTLTVIVNNKKLNVKFMPLRNSDKPVSIHLAYLGMNIKNKVDAGENIGKTLSHSFVVLEHHSHDINTKTGAIDGEIPFMLKKYKGHQPKAIAVWLSYKDDPTPLQAVGGWLDKAKQ